MATENPQHEEIEGASDLEEKEDLARKQLARMRPGLLRARTTITLETMFGAYLFYGKHGEIGRIIGLRHFANSLDKIWKNAPRDPWALWYLLLIETAIDQAQTALESLLQQYQIKLSHQKKFDYRQSFSLKPIHIDIAFSAPLGFRAAKLVVTADDVIKLMLQAHHVDLVRDSEAKRALFKVGNHVRRAFESAMTYREMNVSYKALKKMTVQGQKAIDALGEVPADILSGEKLPRHIPRMHLSTNKPRTRKAIWAEQMAEAFSWSVSDSVDVVEKEERHSHEKAETECQYSAPDIKDKIGKPALTEGVD
jgi:integrating conjugative element protein (TIGR03761 family)